MEIHRLESVTTFCKSW